MSRTKPVTVPVVDLPAYFRSEHDANLIALAIEAEAQHTRDAANAPDLPEVVALTIRAQADAFQTAADETRIAAKWIAQGRTAQRDANAGGVA
jgi:hypothetical protein